MQPNKILDETTGEPRRYGRIGQVNILKSQIAIQFTVYQDNRADFWEILPAADLPTINLIYQNFSKSIL